MEEGTTEDFEKLRQEYLGIGRKVQKVRRVTSTPKPDNRQMGNNQRVS